MYVRERVNKWPRISQLYWFFFVLWSLSNYGTTCVYFPIIKLRSLVNWEVYPYRHSKVPSATKYLQIFSSYCQQLQTTAEEKRKWTAITNTFVEGNWGKGTGGCSNSFKWLGIYPGRTENDIFRTWDCTSFCWKYLWERAKCQSFHRPKDLLDLPKLKVPPTCL